MERPAAGGESCKQDSFLREETFYLRRKIMKKRVLGLLLTTAITALALTGCGQTGSIAGTGSDTKSTGKAESAEETAAWYLPRNADAF
mgnify:CR=1 FL=1